MYLSSNEISQYQKSSDNNSEQHSLPAYEDVLRQNLSSVTNSLVNRVSTDQMNEDQRQLEINVDRLNDSMNLINQQLMSLDDDDDEDDEEDEVSKETKEKNEVIDDKIGRLKIVSMEEDGSFQPCQNLTQQETNQESTNSSQSHQNTNFNYN